MQPSPLLTPILPDAIQENQSISDLQPGSTLISDLHPGPTLHLWFHSKSLGLCVSVCVWLCVCVCVYMCVYVCGKKAFSRHRCETAALFMVSGKLKKPTRFKK